MSADLIPQQSTGSNNITQAARLLAPTPITLAVGILLYGTRLWTIRVRRPLSFEWVDGMIGAALMLAFIDLILTAISCHYGVGRHTEFVDAGAAVRARHYAFLVEPICVWSICLAKCSIAWTILQAGQSRMWKCFFGLIIVIQIVCAIVANIIQLLQCHPTSALWDESVAELSSTHCWSLYQSQISAYVNLSITLVTDMLLSLTPLAFLKGTNRPLHEVIALGLLAGLGLFITLSSVVNMLFLHNYRGSTDVLWDLVTPMAWWQAEQNCSIIASCLLCLRSPLESVLIRLGVITSTRRRSSSSCDRLNYIEDGTPHVLKSLKTTIQWGPTFASTAQLPSITKTTEVVHSTEELRDDFLDIGSPVRRPSWQ